MPAQQHVDDLAPHLVSMLLPSSKEDLRDLLVARLAQRTDDGQLQLKRRLRHEQVAQSDDVIGTVASTAQQLNGKPSSGCDCRLVKGDPSR